MKFVMTQSVCKEGLALLDGKASLYIADAGNPIGYMDEMQGADALIVRIGSCNSEVIAASPRLKVIGRTGVGYDSVDVKAATAAGIPVVITPGANNRSVAEHAVAMIFTLAKNLLEAHTETGAGNWAIRDAGKNFELCGKRVGFIGFGSIGRETQKLCQALGMETAAYDPLIPRAVIEAASCTYAEDYKALLTTCDVISIHVPLLEETRNLIDRSEFALMKKTAILINCARGGIVNEAALLAALNGGQIAGAGTDVFTEEPLKADNPLLAAQNLLISPHSAAQTREAVINMAEMCVNGCLAVCNGEKWPHVANPAVYHHPKWTEK